jgi:hypothetical protein
LTFGLSSTAKPSELWGEDEISTNPKDNNGVVVSINGSVSDDIHNRYHEIDLTASGASGFHLSAIALQAYYNTVDIADLLAEKDSNGKRIASVYEKAAQADIKANTKYKNVVGELAETVVTSSYKEAYTSYSIFESIQKALTYAAKIDTALMNFKKDVLEDRDVRIENDKQIWAAIGNDYKFDVEATKNTISKRLTDIEEAIGDNTTSGTIKFRIKTNEEDIAKLRAELGDEENKTEKTVYERITTLEAAEEAITKSLNNTDAEDAEFTDKTEADVVYKELKSSTAKDVDDDKEEVVLATKASVETLVQNAVAELQSEMTASIKNNRKLAALMAYMKCDDIKASKAAVQFVRSGGSWNGYDMQEKDCRFTKGTSDTGSISIAENNVTFCGESMIQVTLEDYVDHLKYVAYVPYDESIAADAVYTNQTFTYGSNNNATSLDDDSYTVRIY